MSCKVCLYSFILETLLSSTQAFPSSNCTVYSREEVYTLLHKGWDQCLDLILILDDSLNAFLIKCKASCHVFKDSHKVYDEAAFLILVISSVGTTDSLKKSMILHRFVKIHTLEDRCIKSSKEFAGYDDKLERGERIAELIKEFLLLVACPLVRLVVISLITGSVHNDSCLVVCAKKSIKGLLIFNTTLSVINYDLSLHASWLNVLTEVVDDIFTYVVDTLIGSKECFYTRSANKFILILFADMVC